jgi:hypothetical protein
MFLLLAFCEIYGMSFFYFTGSYEFGGHSKENREGIRIRYSKKLKISYHEQNRIKV